MFFPLRSFDGVHNSAGNAWNQPPDFRDHLTAEVSVNGAGPQMDGLFHGISI